jgi:exonuclease VII large subunit
MSKVDEAKGRVDGALDRLERLVEQRLQVETKRADELAAKLDQLERQHEDLKKVANEVEAKLERAMAYIKSLLTQEKS